MQCLEQTRQLVGGDQRHIVSTFAANDHDASILGYFVTKFG
ncbi:MAG TPA: hypothetical protein VIK76_16910 [Pyrinomonadaceae bacterium]